MQESPVSPASREVSVRPPAFSRIGAFYGVVALLAVALYNGAMLLALVPWVPTMRLLTGRSANTSRISADLRESRNGLESVGRLLKVAGDKPSPSGIRLALASDPDLQPAVDQLKEAAQEANEAARAAKAAVAAAQEEEQSLARQSNDQARIFSLVITLTGLFIAISGFVAYKGLDATKDQAKFVLDLAAKQAELVTGATDRRTDLVLSTANQKIDATIEQVEQRAASTLEEIQKQQAKLAEEYPLVSNLEERLRLVAREINGNILSSTNWADLESYELLGPERIEKLLVDEMAVAGLSIYDLGKTPQTKAAAKDIYFKLAAFYVARANSPIYSPSRGPWAAEGRQGYRNRALVYCERAGKFSRDDSFRSAVLLRMQGVVRLGEASDAADAQARTRALDAAEELLKEAKNTNANDAGTDYNLALVHHRRDRWSEAASLLKALLQREQSVNDVQKGKYLPTACINLACARAKLSAEAERRGDTQAAAEAESAALQSLEKGRELAIEHGALPQFLADLGGELVVEASSGAPAGELVVLSERNPGVFKRILDPGVSSPAPRGVL